MNLENENFIGCIAASTSALRFRMEKLLSNYSFSNFNKFSSPDW
jgi:hypothetical protein